MKKFESVVFVVALTILIAVFAIAISCSKQDDNKPIPQYTQEDSFSYPNSGFDIDQIMLDAYKDHLNDNSKGPVKWWKWLVAHSGVGPYLINGQIYHCGLNLPCGECPGLCFHAKKGEGNLAPVNSDHIISEKDYDDGERLIQMADYSDTLFGITFIHQDLTYNDTLFVMDEFYIGDAASEVFNRDSVIILPGIYPLTYSHSDNGSTVIRVRTYNN
jgi:hypothetical protein